MKTPNEIKDEVAKSHGLKDWEEVIGRSFSTLRVHLENEAMEAYAQQFREREKVAGLLPISMKSVKKLKRGDVFIWRSGMTGKYNIHTFHSDAGYGAKTFTEYNEKDGSSMLVNYSGICGVLEGNDH